MAVQINIYKTINKSIRPSHNKQATSHCSVKAVLP